MSEGTENRPLPRRFRRRWRWMLVSVVTLLIWYPISSGPYLYVRGWNGGWGFLGDDPMHRIGGYTPVVVVTQSIDGLTDQVGVPTGLYHRWTAYNRAWQDAGRARRAADMSE